MTERLDRLGDALLSSAGLLIAIALPIEGWLEWKWRKERRR